MDVSGAQFGMGAGGALGEQLGALIGEAIAMGDMDRAREIAWTMSRKYGDLPLPSIMKMYPELMGDTALSDARADSRYTNAEDQALRMMIERARGGMTPEDEANLMRARVEAQNQSRAASGAIDREAARRGFSSNTAARKELAAQAGASRLNQAGVQAAGDASARALQALSMGGNYASGLAGRSLNQANQVGSARDRIQQFNLGRKDQANLYNNEIEQRQFENSLTKLAGETKGLQSYADQLNAIGQSKRRTARATGGAVGSFAGMAAGGM
ncbi:MAG: hypothetical protein SFW67_28625 [Myxococcaceae bacterium]|nr:hypothetical protein [Myxococcaceae bacterium]